MLRAIRDRSFPARLKIQTPVNPNFPNPSVFSLFQWRQSSLSTQSAEKSEKNSRKNAQPLSAFFAEAVGISEKGSNDAGKSEANGGNLKLTEILRKLEGEVRSLNKERLEKGTDSNSSPPPRKGNSSDEVGGKQKLWLLFADKKQKKKEVKTADPIEPLVHKAVYPEMELFAHYLHSKGYLKDATFIRKDKFDSTVFQDSYARGFLKYAALNFGEDHPKIARWLSASDLKKVALFGCPSINRRNAYAAKYLRGFFNIEEREVCEKCTLKNSCKHANEKHQRDASKLNLATVTRVLITYAMEAIPKELVVPEEIRESISRLLMEIINLSQNGSCGRPTAHEPTSSY